MQKVALQWDWKAYKSQGMRLFGTCWPMQYDENYKILPGCEENDRSSHRIVSSDPSPCFSKLSMCFFAPSESWHGVNHGPKGLHSNQSMCLHVTDLEVAEGLQLVVARWCLFALLSINENLHMFACAYIWRLSYHHPWNGKVQIGWRLGGLNMFRMAQYFVKIIAN